jgi:4-hydroxyphenylpyruvate dioxygenase
MTNGSVMDINLPAKKEVTNRLFLNTILLGGSTDDKITAAKSAGFDQIELWHRDVENFQGGAESLRHRLAVSDLGLTDYQVLLDFDGAPSAKRDAKRREALAILDAALRVGADTLLVPASTDKSCDPSRIVEDMRWLAREASARGLRVAHEGMAWSTINHSLPAVWDVVRQIGEPNLGVVIDTFHMFVRGRTTADLKSIPVDKIFLVQLSDLNHSVDLEHMANVARHHRLLPGRGHFPIRPLLHCLRGDGYAGPIGVEVFNDELKAQDPQMVAREAMTSLRHVLPV